MSERLVNTLNERSRQDLIHYAADEVKLAADKATAAAVALSQYRSTHEVFEPDKQAAIQLESVAKIQEELTTTEDWDYLLRTVLVTGVADSPQITSIYRRWSNSESSETVHPRHEWQTNHYRILEKIDRSPLLLPPGSSRVIRELLGAVGPTGAAANGQLIDPALAGAGAQAQWSLGHAFGWAISGEHLRDRLTALYSSTSWRLSAPIRWLGATLGKPTLVVTDPRTLSVDRVRRTIAAIEQSASWRATAPMRRLKQMLGRDRP